MGQDSGGLPHYTAELANSMSEYARVTVLKPNETSADEVLRDEITVINAFKPTDISMQNLFDLKLDVLDSIRGLFSFWNIKLINQIDPDIVHDPTDEFPQVNLFSWVHSVYEDRPYVVTSHETKHGGAGGVLRVVNPLLSLVPDFEKSAAIVHSADQRELLLNNHKAVDEVHVIPHGVYSFFRELDYDEQKEEDKHALFFGSLIPPKGIEYLIDAVPKVSEEVPGFSLTIAGSGSIPDECADVVEQYSDVINIRNEFIPNEEVGTLFSRAQVVVLPYRRGWQTGHSGTLSIAFAFGKPIITSEVGDFPELVGESGAGIVVEPESPEAIADGLIEVFSSDSALDQMSNASSRVADRLSWEKIAEQHFEVYQNLL
ncbi:glycosyltransferase family 4 protein [Haloferax volcanii]|nr:glycosyltransferase family 4 protein [Haloferax volcanii]ELY34304.1 lipopolysaccharide transferase family protein [Haloferax volcanii DS2]MBS8121351.1 glycosyltransferase family 4 protein [Haloferax volcanii]MBS8126359.1 glycosyltransferase family 4 protein [Haloferax volcanii]MBS8130227.1 glycosyltransferase family 4 protein [Haloferax volcanii]MBS8134096.1 glycosyltransferase family 4 protein [Haloferax volcanii]